MKKKIIITLFTLVAILILSFLIPKTTHAVETEDFFSEDITWEWEFFEDGETIEYGLFTPSTAEDYEKIPMVLYFCGNGNTAVSESSLRSSGFPGALESWDLENFSAYVLCPLLGEMNGQWTNAKLDEVVILLDKIIEEYNVDTENIVVCGESAGARGALNMASFNPKYFSKCVVFSLVSMDASCPSIDTICYWTWMAAPHDEATPARRKLIPAYGAENVFEKGTNHGSVGNSATKEDTGEHVRNCTEIIAQT